MTPLFLARALTSPWCPLSWVGGWYSRVETCASRARMQEIFEGHVTTDAVLWRDIIPFGEAMCRLCAAVGIRVGERASLQPWTPRDDTSPAPAPRREGR